MHPLSKIRVSLGLILNMNKKEGVRSPEPHLAYEIHFATLPVRDVCENLLIKDL